VTIGFSYFVAGLIPLIPYFFVDEAVKGLYASSVVTLVCLLVFGYIKALITSPEKAWWGAIQTALVGGVAAGEKIFIYGLY
jgi:VIT1/CCC1 family predicted Fe2+/Mn2+ transporter